METGYGGPTPGERSSYAREAQQQKVPPGVITRLGHWPSGSPGGGNRMQVVRGDRGQHSHPGPALSAGWDEGRGWCRVFREQNYSPSKGRGA